MRTDIKKRKLIEFYEDLPPAGKEEALDFIKWLWVSKESKFLEQKSQKHWLKKLYLLFAGTRKQAGKSSAKGIDSAIEKAVKEVRKKHA